MNNFRKRYGPWALVTGASSGIGEEFARQLAANYAATKAHVLSLAEALAHEMKPHDVDVLALSPGFTATEMTRDLDASALPMKPIRVEPVVIQALAHLDKTGRRR